MLKKFMDGFAIGSGIGAIMALIAYVVAFRTNKILEKLNNH